MDAPGNTTLVEANNVVAWFFLPIFFVLLVYITLTMFVWPLARPVIPLWTILFFVFFPPLFPFFLLYVLTFIVISPPPPATVVVERGAPAQARMYAVERGSPRTINAGSRV